MTKTDSKKVEIFFHGYARDFDSIYGHTKKRGFLGRLTDRVLRKSMFLRFQEVLKNTADPRIKSVLDVGCGSGRYCLELLNQGKRVIGLDLAEGMLKLAEEAAARSSARQNIAFVHADYLQHDFKEQFDAACLMGFFDYIQDPAAIFKKLKVEVRHEIYASFPRSSGFLAKQRQVRYRLRNCPLYLYSEEDIHKLMESCGFKGRYSLKDLGRDFFIKIQLQAL